MPLRTNKKKSLCILLVLISPLISTGSFWRGKTVPSISYLISEPNNLRLNWFSDMKELKILQNGLALELLPKLPPLCRSGNINNPLRYL